MSSAETHTFITNDKEFQLTVKKEFLKNVSNPETMAFHDLLTSHEIGKYLHNPHGPAILCMRNKYEDYWLDGIQVSDEVKQRLIHSNQFHDRMEKFIETDDKV